MPATILPNPVDSLLGPDSSQLAVGQDGKLVDQEAEAAASHWAMLETSIGIDDDDFSYVPMPIEIIGDIDVIYEHIGRLKPLPFPAR